MQPGKAELLADCNTLLPLKATLAGSATLNWSETTPIGSWNGITVGGSPERVTGLGLSSKGLTGSIPSGLGDLSNLTTLNLSGNQLTGSIPSGLGDLSNLGTLNLSGNQLSGAIPSELGDLSSLTTLDLSTNQLHGVIPSDLGGLSNLGTLNLSGNRLSGPIPSRLGNLSNLNVLDLSGNDLDWEIPEELNQLDKLEQVWLNGNIGVIGTAHLDFSALSEAHLGYMETETWVVADFSSASSSSVSGGADSSHFAITSGGVLTFKTAPDYEAKADNDNNNKYEVVVTASAGGVQKTAMMYVYVMDRAVALSVSPGSIAEEASLTVFVVTATRDGGATPNTATTVALALSGTATGSGGDYNAVVPSVMTIPGGLASGTATLSITPRDDAIVEGEETIRVEGTVSGSSVSSAWITIDEVERGTLSLSGSGTAVLEGNDASYTVSLSHAIDHEVTVGWSVTPDTGDFSAASGSVTFAAGSSANATMPLTLTATDDLLSEGLESFSVMLGTVTGEISDRISVDPQAGSAVVMVAASDQITVTLSGDSSVNEGESASYTVSLSPDGVTPTANLTVDYDTADGTAGSADYEGVLGTLAFTSSDAAAKTVTVQTTEDSIAEDNETFSFGLSLSDDPGGGGPLPSLSDPSSITTTIDDDDAEPTDITLSVDSDEVSEGDSMATTVTLTATLEGGTTRNTATTVALSLSGTATATGSGADYTAVVPSEMTIPAEEATGTATLIITPTNDVIVEGEETIRVEGAVSDITVSPAEITINDADQGTLSLSGSGTAVSEGNDASYTVSLSHAIGHEVTVGWSVTPDSGDFSTPSGNVTFAAGSTANATTTLTLTATDDSLSEVAESFTVRLGTVTGDISDRISVDAQANSAVVRIESSDPITVIISGSSSVALSGSSSVDEGGLASYTVSLSPNGVTPTADLTVDYATADDTAGSDDYEGVLGTLTFTSSDAGAEIVTVQTTEDSIAEDNETFSFGLSLSDDPGGGGPLPSLSDPSSITTTIDDDDAEPTDITLSVDSDEVSEGDSMATTVTLTATLEGGTTRNTATTVALSLSGTATAIGSGADYTAVVPSEMTIPAEEATGTATLIITPTDDVIVEGEETIRVEGAVSDITVSPAEITINDADQGTLSLSGSGTAVSEGNDASYTVRLSHAIGHEVTVGWSVTPDSGDFSTPSGSVTFEAGSTANATTTLTLTATDDSLSEVAESFTVRLGTVTGDISDRISVDAQANSAGVTIESSDRITVTLSGDSSVDEGESATYTVSLSPNGVTPTADLTVDYATADDTAGSDDYEGVLGTLTFTSSDAGAEIVTVQTTEDSIAEDNETFSFGLSLSDDPGGGGPLPSLSDPSSITTTIDDDDAEPTDITLSVDSDEVSEGDSMATTVTLTATLEGGTTRNTATTVALSLSGTATAIGSGADYTAVVPSEMTIPAGEATGTATLSITPTDDEIVEGEETIRVEGAVSDITVSPAEITINDADQGTLSLSGSGTAVSEGNDASYTVSLSHAIGRDVTVGWSVTPDSGDFSTPSGSVTFEAGSTANATTTLTLTATDDSLSEVAESFTVMLGTVTGDISDRISVDAQANSAGVTIESSDRITVTLSGDSSVDEGESATYTVSLSPNGVTPTADLTVDYATADDTAGSDDYEGVLGTLTFTSSDTEDKTVTVQTTEDSIVEGEETFSFTLSDVSGGGGPTPSLGNPSYITTTIIDDDRRRTQRPPANDAPTFNEGATTTRAALEDSEVGTEVGEPVRATDRDGDRLEYRLRGTDRASFHLDPRTGQLTTALLLDYETQSEYSVRVRVRDGEGGSDGIDVTITIVDLDEAPSQPGAPEVRSTGPTGLAVSWTAPDNQGPEITDYDVRYREAGGEFQDAEFVGADTSITLNNLKPGTSYEVQVRAVNAEGASPWSESGRDETEHVPPSPTPTPTPTPEPTATPTPTPEPTATPTPTPEPTATPTPTPEPTATPTPTPETTATPTPTPEPTATPTPTPEPTATPTPTPEPTATPTPTPESTATPTPMPESTATPTPTPESTATPTPTPESTATPTPTPESTATATPTPEPTTTPMAPPLSAPAPTSTLSPPPTSAPIATATPAVTPERRESDSEGGLPWWVILLLSLGGVGVVLFAWIRRRRRQG